MPPIPRDVVVTGLGVVCAVARDRAELAEAIECGRGGIGPIRRFDTAAFDVHTGAEVPADAVIPNGSSWQNCLSFAERAAREAVGGARLDAVSSDRIGLAFGTGLGDVDHALHELAEALARRIGVSGPIVTVSTACSSSTSAVGLARDIVATGGADAMVAGGADVLTPEVFAGFHALRVLTPGKCAPFSEPFGTTLGEGAGFLVLERSEAARTRGADAIVALTGYGLAGDGYHETSPDPQGGGVRRAVVAALADAGVVARDIGYVNAHGSGTEANDPAEFRGIAKALEGSSRIPVSSSKGALGHAQGAAGVLETIVTILAMQRGQIAPTLNFHTPRRFAPPDPVRGPRPRAARVRHALCLSSAFGGSNSALVISRLPHVEVRPRARAAVRILGAGVVGPFGLGVEALPAHRGPLSGRVPDFDLQRLAPRLDPRGLDPLSRFLAAAAHLALADSGVQIRGALVDRTGLVAGAVRPSPCSIAHFRQSIEERGLRDLSAAAFARIVLNAPAGFCSKLLALRGPLTVVSVGAGSGLAAILFAAELLSTRSEVELILAAGADEMGTLEPSTPSAEGAACLLLGRGNGAPDPGAGVQVGGWAMAGPGRLRDAIAQARAMGDDDGPVETVFDEGDFASGRAAAMPSALAGAAAVVALRRGEASRAWVTSGRGDSVSSALLLTA